MPRPETLLFSAVCISFAAIVGVAMYHAFRALEAKIYGATTALGLLCSVPVLGAVGVLLVTGILNRNFQSLTFLLLALLIFGLGTWLESARQGTSLAVASALFCACIVPGILTIFLIVNTPTMQNWRWSWAPAAGLSSTLMMAYLGFFVGLFSAPLHAELWQRLAWDIRKFTSPDVS